MSGLEILGAVAAAGQLLSAIGNLIQHSHELRKQIEQGPELFRHQTEDLDTLIDILDHIRNKTSLHKPAIEKYITILQSRVESLRKSIGCYKNRLAKRQTFRILKAFSIVESGKSIPRHFEALNRDKTTLILFVSASLNENIYLLSNRITMSQGNHNGQAAKTTGGGQMVGTNDPRDRISSIRPSETVQKSADSESQAPSSRDDSQGGTDAPKQEQETRPSEATRSQSNLTFSNNSGGFNIGMYNR